jgi:DHA1 family bicyclomycin/chloramphenicol resistance-like MFS transporter
VSAPLEAAPPGRRAGSAGLAVLLTLLVAMGPVSTDLYLPSLPGIARDLETSDALAQLTIGLFIAGFAVMMLVCGPLADRLGRRPVLLGGVAVFVLASVVCALSPDIWVLLGARFVQALGASVGPVVGRAIVRDVYGPRDAGRILGYMASATAFAPLVAPFVGGWLEVAFGWRASFWLLTAYGVALSLMLALRLEETLERRAAGPFLSIRLLHDFRLILTNRAFLGFMLCVALTSGALFTWISNSAFVVIDHFGVPPQRFGWAFGAVIAGYIAGAFAGSRVGMRFGLSASTASGTVIAALAGIGLVVVGWTGQGGLAAIVALMALSFLGVGLVIPQATAGALGPFPTLAGTASALMGFLQMMTGLMVIAASGLLFDGTPWPMVSLNALCALLALAAYALLLRRAPVSELSRRTGA